MSSATTICHESDADRLRSAQSVRVAAIDLLRGSLVLFSAAAWLLPPAIREWPGNAVLEVIGGQLEPSVWQGITLFDLLMPGFLFVMGLSAAFTTKYRRSQGQDPGAILAHLVRRCAVLFVIGLILDGGLPCPWSEIRWLGPWQRIAICNFCVGCLCLAVDWKVLLLLAGLILAGYGLVFEVIPITPPFPQSRGEQPLQVNPYSMEQNVAAHLDQMFLPGRKYFGNWDPYGLLTTVPALAVALLGAVGSHVPMRPVATAGGLAGFMPILIAMAFLNAGFLMSEWQPMNASLLTTTFVLVATGVYALTYACLSLPERSAAWSKRTAALGHAGKNALVLMVALHVIGKFGSMFLFRIAQAEGISRFYPQTMVALAGLAGLWWLSRRLSRYDKSVSTNNGSVSKALSSLPATPPPPPS